MMMAPVQLELEVLLSSSFCAEREKGLQSRTSDRPSLEAQSRRMLRRKKAQSDFYFIYGRLSIEDSEAKVKTEKEANPAQK